MKIVFERGDRGLICKSPEDDGAWVVPAYRSKHVVSPIDGHIVAVEIIGTSANGRLRFARVVEDVSVMQDAALESIKKASAEATTFDELKGQTWGAVGIASYVSPWTYDVKTCLDGEGRPAVESVKVIGFLKAEWGRVEQCSYDAPTIKLERPLPLGTAEVPLMLSYWVLALATPGYVSKEMSGWAAEFVAQVGELSVAVRLLEERTGETWYSRPKPSSCSKDWPVMYWLRDEAIRTCASNLRELIAKVELPLEAVKGQLIDLTADRPTHVLFSDGHERTIKWSGSYGRVWVPREVFSALTLDSSDERVEAIKEGGHSFWLETSWEVQTCGDRHNDFDSYRASDRRRLI